MIYILGTPHVMCSAPKRIKTSWTHTKAVQGLYIRQCLTFNAAYWLHPWIGEFQSLSSSLVLGHTAESDTIDSSRCTCQLNGGGFEWNIAYPYNLYYPYNGGLPESKAAWRGGKWAGLKIKMIQPLNVQEGNQTVPTDTHQGTITEDSIVSGLQRLAVLIEKENEVTKEFQDLMLSTPQNEVTHIIKRKYFYCIPSIYLLISFVFKPWWLSRYRQGQP